MAIARIPLQSPSTPEIAQNVLASPRSTPRVHCEEYANSRSDGETVLSAASKYQGGAFAPSVPERRRYFPPLAFEVNAG
jgi:hypothetical protein